MNIKRVPMQSEQYEDLFFELRRQLPRHPGEGWKDEWAASQGFAVKFFHLREDAPLLEVPIGPGVIHMEHFTRQTDPKVAWDESRSWSSRCGMDHDAPRNLCTTYLVFVRHRTVCHTSDSPRAKQRQPPALLCGDGGYAM